MINLRRSRVQPQPRSHPLCSENGAEALFVFFTCVADEDVIVLWPVLHLGDGIGHAQFKGGGVFSAATRETGTEFLDAGWQDEDIKVAALEELVLARAHLGGSLHVDVEKDVHAALQVVEYEALQRTIPTAILFRMMIS